MRLPVWMVAALGVCAGGCGQSNVPAYVIQFNFIPRDTGGRWNPVQAKDPVQARFYAYRHMDDARITIPVDSQGHRHPISFIVRDPDGLVTRWRRSLTKKEYIDEVNRWWTDVKGIHLEVDFRKWMPAGFQWIPGEYRIKAIAWAGTERVESMAMPLFWRKYAAPNGPILSSRLEADKEVYQVDETIKLRGFVENVGTRPFALQTKYPFREIRLISSPWENGFPVDPVSGTLRASHFTILEPGQEIRLFEETFVAGREDPHWGGGFNISDTPGPFSGRDLDVSFVLNSEGLFPQDRQLSVGIWTGKLTSNSVRIAMKATP